MLWYRGSVFEVNFFRAGAFADRRVVITGLFDGFLRSLSSQSDRSVSSFSGPALPLCSNRLEDDFSPPSRRIAATALEVPKSEKLGGGATAEFEPRFCWVQFLKFDFQTPRPVVIPWRNIVP